MFERLVADLLRVQHADSLDRLQHVLERVRRRRLHVFAQRAVSTWGAMGGRRVHLRGQIVLLVRWRRRVSLQTSNKLHRGEQRLPQQIQGWAGGDAGSLCHPQTFS